MLELALVFLGLLSPESKPYYEGLPELERNPPFASQTKEQAKALHDVMSQAKGLTGSCAGQPRAVQGALEVCGSDLAGAREMLKTMQHGLPPGQFSRLWLVDLDGAGSQDLIAQYDTKAKNQTDRYAAFFDFRWETERYRVTPASWFLEGSLHAFRSFGATQTKKAFFRYLSCTECHPWVYLLALDFTVPPIGAAYEFGYDPEDPESRQTEIEYELPGGEDSIDAKVETRLPDHPDPAGPHMLQHFEVQDGEDEWWSFTCKDLQCAPQMFTGKPPARLLDQWKKATPL